MAKVDKIDAQKLVCSLMTYLYTRISPELNPCEKVWQYLKERFKNKTFKNIKELKQWLNQTVAKEINTDNIISIVKNQLCIDSFKACFNS